MYALTLVLLFIIRIRFPANRSIAQIITSRYGQQTLQLIRKFESTDLKHKKCELDINFLTVCVEHELLPTFVRFKVANAQLHGSKAHKDCQLRLLRQELLNKKNKLAFLTKRLLHLKSEVANSVSWIDFAHISNIFLRYNDNRLTKARLVQEKKLLNLGLHTAEATNDPEKVIFNSSSRILSPAEKSLLAKGLNFSLPPKKLNYADALAPFEQFYRDIDSSGEQFVRDGHYAILLLTFSTITIPKLSKFSHLRKLRLSNRC